MMRNPGFGLDSFYAKGAKGCIVELYQFRCTDESLPLRVLSRQGEVPLYALGGEAVSEPGVRPHSGPHGYLRGGPSHGLCRYHRQGEGGEQRDGQEAGDGGQREAGISVRRHGASV